MDRMLLAVEKVRDRLIRATEALNRACIDYAVVGGNAVAVWVARVDVSAVRNTRDVDLLVRREDFERVKAALENAGLIYRHVRGLDVFLDEPDAQARDGVHVVFSLEYVRPGELSPNPDVTESEDAGTFRVLNLPALVRIKLTAFRDKDRTHLRDMIDVGLIDDGWLERLPNALADRLKSLLDTPDG